MESLSILVVDDDPVIRRLLHQRLKNENFRVTVAEDGHAASKLLQEQRFDVVLTDLVMPGGLGGIEVLETTKELSPNTEVVLITAHSSVNTAVEAMKKGAADYLEKPINFDELLLRMDKIANLKTILKNAKDLEQAMTVTEREASITIQNLEEKIILMQEALEKLETILRDTEMDKETRINTALTVLAPDNNK